MACIICGRSACASWIHSLKEREEYAAADGMTQQQMRAEIVDLRRKVKTLKEQLDGFKYDS